MLIVDILTKLTHYGNINYVIKFVNDEEFISLDDFIKQHGSDVLNKELLSYSKNEQLLRYEIIVKE